MKLFLFSMLVLVSLVCAWNDDDDRSDDRSVSGRREGRRYRRRHPHGQNREDRHHDRHSRHGQSRNSNRRRMGHNRNMDQLADRFKATKMRSSRRLQVAPFFLDNSRSSKLRGIDFDDSTGDRDISVAPLAKFPDTYLDSEELDNSRSKELDGSNQRLNKQKQSSGFGDYGDGASKEVDGSNRRLNKEKQSSGFGDYGDGASKEVDGSNQRWNKQNQSSGFGDYGDGISEELDGSNQRLNKQNQSSEFGDYGSEVQDSKEENEDEKPHTKFDFSNLFGSDFSLPDWGELHVEVNVPKWFRQLFQGSVHIGEPGAGLEWNVGSLFDELGDEWWTGSNVCERKETTLLRNGKEVSETGGNRHLDIRRHHTYGSAVCDQTPTAYRCTTTVGFLGLEKTITTILECCAGYQREPDISGCTKELKLEDLMTTVKELGVSEFAEALDAVRWTDLLQDSNYTVFAPSNKAMQEYLPQKETSEDVVIINPEIVKVAQNLERVLSAHLMPGIVRTSSLKDEQLVSTEDADAKIRVNIYEVPKRLVTANCVPVTSPDNMATNGVVHIVDKVLSPVTASLLKTVAETPGLIWFAMALEKSDLASVLKKDGQYTVFAPSDVAFNKLSSAARDKLLSGNGCLNNIIRNHVLPNVICSSIIDGRVRTINMLDRYLHLWGENSATYVQDVEMVNKDVMATNGVLHVIDEILLPEEARGLVEQAQEAGATDAIDLMEEAGLTKTLHALQNFTVFLPTNRAIQEVPEEVVRQWRQDPDSLAKVLRYHIVPQVLDHSELHNGLELDTMGSDKQISVHKYISRSFHRKSVTTAQCASLMKTDVGSCGGVVHLVDKVLLPPTGDVLDVLYQQDKFSVLVKMLKKAGDLVEEVQRADSITFLAPTNQAFESVNNSRQWELIERDPEKLKDVLQGHIISGTLCCAGVFDNSWLWPQTAHTLDGGSVTLDRRHRVPVVEDVPLASCDLTATNGVVHGIDQLLPDVVSKHSRHHYWP